MSEKVVAVVVAYNSDMGRLEELLSVLSGQCTVVVVDNSTTATSREEIYWVCSQARIVLIQLGDNFGIAHAQNVGIDWARKQAATDVLLLDDDSVPTESFVTDLLGARKIFRFGTVIVGARTISAIGEDISNRLPESCGGLTSCTELTSSGTLIPTVVFDRVGTFSEHLFIDCVDFEWGWRASALGIPLFLCDRVAIQHRLGESSRFGLRIPSPIRHYYQYRNILKMIFDSNAPFQWRFSQLIKLPVKLVLILFLADHRIVRLRYAGLGVYDFIFGRFGKYNH